MTNRKCEYYGCKNRAQSGQCMTRDCVNSDKREAFEQGYAMGVKAAKKRSYWVEESDVFGDTLYRCASCGDERVFVEGTPWSNDINYCPHCGAFMVEKG